MIQIYHNPRCSKSREAIKILQQHGAEFETVFYLENPPSKKHIKHIIDTLNVNALDIMRVKESILKEKAIDVSCLNEDQCIDLICEYPILLERPIVINKDKAVIARPPESVLSIL